jgi:hypothetical protein
VLPDWRLETQLHKLQNSKTMAAKCHETETAETRRRAAATGLPKGGDNAQL